MKSKNFDYKFIVTDNKVIALSHDAGKVVRGVAKCSPNDEFNVEFGKKLAAARCNLKVAQRREARAVKKFNACREALYAAERRDTAAVVALSEAFEGTDAAIDMVNELLGREDSEL